MILVLPVVTGLSVDKVLCGALVSGKRGLSDMELSAVYFLLWQVMFTYDEGSS